ncbi:MAG: hypothetical protein AAGH48_03970 [Pseudomonadota bacterium]
MTQLFACASSLVASQSLPARAAKLSASVCASLLIAGCVSSATGFLSPQSGRAPRLGPAYVSAEIMGLDGPRLDAALGEPALSRREGTGELRRFSFESCSVLAFLYPSEGGDGAPVVTHLDAVSVEPGAAVGVDACLQDPAAPRKAG